MTTYFLEPPGRLLDAAKRAALDAVAGYEHLNPYTIGVAVQAAASVLRTDVHPPTNRISVEVRGEGGATFVDATSIEVTPRLRALEAVAEAARATHVGMAHAVAEPCPLCAALRHLEQAG
jgi:hypothetical protein